MSKLGALEGFPRRRRRAIALVGIVLALGLIGLDMHGDLPDHHSEHGKATVCIAALAIGILAVVAMARRPKSDLPWRWSTFVPNLVPVWIAAPAPLVGARAGPLDQTVLRL